MKTCIICRINKPFKDKKNKDNFNKEHLFPEAAGGNFTIKSVCKNCNENLGERIDSHFLKHDIVSYFRSIYNIRRGRRKLPKPFQNFNKKNSDLGYTLEIIDGQLRRRIKTKSVKTENGVRYITDDLTYSKEFEEKIKKKVAKKHNVSPHRIEVSMERTTDKGMKLFMETPNNPLIMEATKISYELACEKIPKYLEDPIGKRFAKMLELGEIDRELLINRILPVDELTLNFIASDFSPNQHVAILYYRPQFGLMATVSFFAPIHDLSFSVLLSENTSFHKLEPIILVNDYVNTTSKLVHIK